MGYGFSFIPSRNQTMDGVFMKCGNWNKKKRSNDGDGKKGRESEGVTEDDHRRMSTEHDDAERRSPKLRQESLRSYRSLANFHRDLIAGAVMGGAVHTIVAPIERAKLLLQTQESNMAIVASGHRKFKGMFDCILRTVREEGILSQWRGNGSSVLRYYPSVALNFSLKDLYRNILRSENYYDNNVSSGASANFIAGAAAGCTTLVLVYPLDIAHTCLAVDVGRTEMHQFRGIYHFLATIYRKDGIIRILGGAFQRLYKGWWCIKAFTSEALIQ